MNEICGAIGDLLQSREYSSIIFPMHGTRGCEEQSSRYSRKSADTRARAGWLRRLRVSHEGVCRDLDRLWRRSGGGTFARKAGGPPPQRDRATRSHRNECHTARRSESWQLSTRSTNCCKGLRVTQGRGDPQIPTVTGGPPRGSRGSLAIGWGSGRRFRKTDSTWSGDPKR